MQLRLSGRASTISTVGGASGDVVIEIGRTVYSAQDAYPIDPVTVPLVPLTVGWVLNDDF